MPKIEKFTIKTRIELIKSKHKDKTVIEEYLKPNELVFKDVIEERITKNLGHNFRLKELKIKEGSIEILLIISYIGSAIIQYKPFREGLKALKSDIESIFSFFLKSNKYDTIIYSEDDIPYDVNISSNSIGAEKTENLKNTYKTKELPSIDVNKFALLILIIYLFITNIIMLFVLIQR